ncbi:MAG: GTPase ObgE, partial [Candidatus Promineifilaceae bacterium]
MFYDEAKIYIRSGDGGNGMSSFRREKFVPYGGPDGGDGGKGGDIIFKVNPKLNTLAYFHRRVHFKAQHGTRGGRSNQSGKQGTALVLAVPPGTIIREFETERLLADLTNEEQAVVLLAGGAGGRGNSRFATSTNQAPMVAEKGVQGREQWITMELKLIADVGLLGKPNAGKSTLLAKVSAAKPKIANYPFTTLQPNLGVVDLDDYQSFVMADIPGLIEGAADGVGLGHDFLRHIERNRILIHLLDGIAAEPLEDFKGLNEELKIYSPALAEKPQLVVLNKMDTPDAEAWEPLIREEVEAMGYEFMSISAATGQNVRE